MFPPGTPVWYNFRSGSGNKNIMRAFEGVVRSMSFSNTMGGQTVYEVLRNKNTPGSGIKIVSVDFVGENNIAYGSQCPVHVKTVVDETSCKEMNGEIISPCFTEKGKAGSSTLTYIVKMTSGDGGILIEENVSADRVRYRFGLDQIRAKLNEKCNSATSIGIRTSSLGLPLRRIRRKYERHIQNTVISQPLSCDQTTSKNSNDRLRIDKKSWSVQKSASSENLTLCAHENCNFRAQENYGRYCFAHYHQLCMQKRKHTLFSSDASFKSDGTEKAVVDEDSKLLQSKPEIVDLTEDDH